MSLTFIYIDCYVVQPIALQFSVVSPIIYYIVLMGINTILHTFNSTKVHVYAVPMVPCHPALRTLSRIAILQRAFYALVLTTAL